MASRDELKRMIDALPEAETDHALVLLGALLRPMSRPDPVESREREEWVGAAMDATATRLAELESDVPADLLGTWLATWEAAGKPIRWDQTRGDFIEVSG